MQRNNQAGRPMSTVLSISASPQQVSSTHALLTHVNRRVLGAGSHRPNPAGAGSAARALLSADAQGPGHRRGHRRGRRCRRRRGRHPGLPGGVLRSVEGVPGSAAAVRFSRQGGPADRHRRITGPRSRGRLRLAAGAGQPRRRAYRAGLVRPVVAHPSVARRRGADRSRRRWPRSPRSPTSSWRSWSQPARRRGRSDPG